MELFDVLDIDLLQVVRMRLLKGILLWKYFPLPL